MSKILYFGSFDKPFDTEVYVTNTLEKQGHTVEKRTASKTSNDELRKLLKGGYDFVLLSKGWFVDEEGAIQIIKNSGVKTVGWFWDLCWGTPRKHLLKDHHLFHADEVYTSDGGDWDWSKYGIKHKILRQGIYSPEAIKGNFKQEYAYDVIFVGTNSHGTDFQWKHRQELLHFLKKYYGDRFRHLGVGGDLRNLELNDVYASAKVVVGDSVYSKNYWSNRLYETMGRNGFLVFPMIEGLEKEFTPYKHFIPYDYYDFVGLAEKVDYYIEHDKERNEIRDAGFEHCKAYHTYDIRCEQLIKNIYDR